MKFDDTILLDPSTTEGKEVTPRDGLARYGPKISTIPTVMVTTMTHKMRVFEFPPRFYKMRK
jgi:hypothetical protein